MRRTVEELGELEWLTDESLAAARRTLVRREMERVYFAEDRAQAIGQARWWLGDEALAIEAPRRIEAVTREQVAAAFRAYVQDGRAVEVYLKPEHVPLVVRLFGWLYPLVHR